MTAALLYGIDWRESAQPDYPAEVAWIAELLQSLATKPMDSVTLFVAANLVYVLQRTATGHQGLGILQAWFTPRFAGFTTAEQVRRSCDWLSRTVAARQAAIADLAEMLEVVKGEQGDDGEFVDFEFELADGKNCRNGLPGDDFAALEQTPAVKELRRAIHSYRAVYPCRRYGDVLHTRAAMKAAMPAKQVRG